MRRRLFALAMALTMALSLLPTSVMAAETAETIRMQKTEGTVKVTNGSGKAQNVRADMRIYNGWQVSTEKKSYAYLSLDDDRAAKLDEAGKLEVRKNGKKLELLVNAGSLYFGIDKPLASNETLNIRTTTTVTGIRGTDGIIGVNPDGTTRICVLKGRVESEVTDPVTGKSIAVEVNSGEKVDVAIGENGELVTETASLEADDIPAYVLVELVENPEKLEAISEATDGQLDLTEMTAEQAEARLEAEQAETEEKLNAVAEEQAQQPSNVENEGKPTQTSSREDHENNGGGNQPVQPTRTVTLTMPINASDINAAFADATVQTVKVVTEPNSGNTLGHPNGFDAVLTVPAGRTLEVGSANDPINVNVNGTGPNGIQVYGTMTASSGLTVNYAPLTIDGGTLTVAGDVQCSGATSFGAKGGTLTTGGELQIPGGSLTVGQNATIKANNGVNLGYATVNNAPTFSMTGGRIEANSANPALTIQSSVPAGNVTISGGTITNEDSSGTGSAYAIRMANGSQIPAIGSATVRAKQADVVYPASNSYVNYPSGGYYELRDASTLWTVEFSLGIGAAQGARVADQTVAVGDKVTKPADPAAAAGYVFDAWYTDSNYSTEWNFNTDTLPANPTQGGFTLYGKFTYDTGPFTVTGGMPVTDYTYAGNVLTVNNVTTALTIQNTTAAATTDRIVVTGGSNAVNVTLNGVNIDTSAGTDAALMLDDDGSNQLANITITLQGTNTLKSAVNCAGLQKDTNAPLIITGTGSLTATGGDNGAGIGGGNGSNGSNITIYGTAHVEATGGKDAAGIGGGNGANGTDININTANGNSNSAYVKATGGSNTTNSSSTGGAGIGGGTSGSGTGINIGGGTVIATGGDNGAGIGGGYNKAGSSITISGGTVTANGGLSAAGVGGGYGGNGGGDVSSGNGITISGGTVHAYGGYNGAGIGGGTSGNGTGITITGGTVTATGGASAAGIGGGYGGNGGDGSNRITISGAVVTATGGNNGAGIGGGESVSTGGGFGGYITITESQTATETQVTANGKGKGAGIGGGMGGVGDSIAIFGTLYGASYSAYNSANDSNSGTLSHVNGDWVTATRESTAAPNLIGNGGT